MFVVLAAVALFVAVDREHAVAASLVVDRLEIGFVVGLVAGLLAGLLAGLAARPVAAAAAPISDDCAPSTTAPGSPSLPARRARCARADAFAVAWAASRPRQ